MATVTVLKFSNPQAAADALHIVHNLDEQHLITLIDAALIAWPAGKKSPTSKLLLTPLLAMAIEEGTSALFLITTDAVLDRVADAMKAAVKIGVVGCGMVGSTSAYALVMSGVGREIVLVDVNRARVEAEANDIFHAVPFAHPLIVRAGDYEDLCGGVAAC